MEEEEIVERLAAAHAARRQFASSEAAPPPEVGAVYRIQDALYARLASGARPRAWKVGGPGADAEPTIAPILPGRLLASGTTVVAREFHFIGIEAEVAFRVRRDIAHEAELTGAIGEALVAIELCDSRLADWQSAAPLWKLADNQLNWGLVLGSGTERWQEIDFRAQRAELWIGGERRVAVQGVHPYGTPFALLPWTVAHASRRTGGLRAGDIVTTGSWGGMHFAAAGDEIIARFPGLGEARLGIAK
jgi:2-keto-4-pentenoate hydratase